MATRMARGAPATWLGALLASALAVPALAAALVCVVVVLCFGRTPWGPCLGGGLEKLERWRNEVDAGIR